MWTKSRRNGRSTEGYGVSCARRKTYFFFLVLPCAASTPSTTAGRRCSSHQLDLTPLNEFRVNYKHASLDHKALSRGGERWGLVNIRHSGDFYRNELSTKKRHATAVPITPVPPCPRLYGGAFASTRSGLKQQRFNYRRVDWGCTYLTYGAAAQARRRGSSCSRGL